MTEVQYEDPFLFLEICMYYPLLIRSTNSSGVSISILEKPKHFLPKSLMDAPMWYTSSSIQRKRSCDKRNVSTSIGAYWALWRSMSSWNWRLICQKFVKCLVRCKVLARLNFNRQYCHSCHIVYKIVNLTLLRVVIIEEVMSMCLQFLCWFFCKA